MRHKKQRLNPDQIPLLTPDSDWTVPTELPDLTRVPELALDTETRDDGLAQGRGPGWVYRAGYVCGVSVAWRWSPGAEIQRIYAPVRHPETECLPKENVARWVRDITRRARVKFFNAPYDCGWLRADMGVEIPPLVDDASCMAVMVDENRNSDEYSLDSVCEWRGIPGKDEILLRDAAAAYGIDATKKREVKKNLWRLPARYVGPYAEQDAGSTLELCDDLMVEMEKQRMLEAYRLEMDLVPLIQEMRWRGIRVDTDYIEQARDGLMQRSQRALDELSDRLRVRVGMDEILSPGWLMSKFSQENVTYHVEKDAQTREEKASFAKDWMRQGYVGRYESGRAGHWLPLLIAEAKQCNDAAQRFMQKFLLDYAHNGRIHASINQFRSEEGGTRSHRMSINDPPLQQSPSRPEPIIKSWTLTAELADIFRQGFLPEEGEVWGALDYSQQEYRLMVHYAVLESCAKADEAAAKYHADPATDFHNLVVELTGLIRSRAKDCNFAKAFGAGIRKFAAMTGMTLEEAGATMTKYDGEMPFIKQLSGICERKAQHRGWIKLLDGARCHFDEWECAWLDKEERERGWREGWPMAACSLSEARARVAGECPRPWRAVPEASHPWLGRKIKRAYTHKAMNRLIQGGAARMTKIAMRECWRAGIVPVLQMHDELDFSFPRTEEGRAQAEQAQAIMRDAVPLRVPMLVDAEFGPSWGKAKQVWEDAMRTERRAA